MKIIRQMLANLLELLGVGTGDRNIPIGDVAELRGFRPYPVVPSHRELDHEWVAGLPWYLKNIEGNKVADCGFMHHLEFTKSLAELGLDVTGIDILDYISPTFTTIRTLVWNIKLVEEFDTIIANSLLEHLGLSCYGQPSIPNADKLTMSAFHNALKVGGVLLLQVPFSAQTVMITHRGKDFYKTYTDSTLRALTEGFIVEEEYFVARSKGMWLEVSKNIACKIRARGGYPSCLAFVKARKIP